jgi:NAD(P)-dependent dehydrogenase (short-subunit alcohol dehydrogenase family)
MAFNLSGKVVLVAGGAGYLGHPICRMLAGQGAAVIIADAANERAETLADEIRGRGGRARAVPLDGGDETSCQAAVAFASDAFGRLDTLVVATYRSISKTVDELSAAEFDEANRVNITGTFVLARAAAKVMPAAGGSIILFASMYGLVSPDPRAYHPPMNPNPIEYGVGKAAIVQMAKYLAVAWGPRNIRVNAIAPGPFPTSTTQQQHPEFVQRLADKVPLGRIGRQDEVAGAVAFLAADESSYMSGTTLRVDGGWTAW